MKKCYVWEYGERERDRGQNIIQSKGKLNNAYKGRTFSKVIGWGDGAGDEKKYIFIRKKKIVEEIKGVLKKERKKKNMQVENSPLPP